MTDAGRRPEHDPLEREPAIRLFRIPNFSLFVSAQVLLNTGAWFQNLAIALIILDRTGSASALALVTVAQFTPLLILAGVAGKAADSISPRTVLLIAAVCAVITTSSLAVIVRDDEMWLGWLYVLIALGGCVSAFERISSQAFIFEIVGAARLKNAVVLNTMTFSSARSIGPGLAGVVFIALGPVACLVVNACAYALAFLALLAIRPAQLQHRRPDTGVQVSFRQVFRELRRNLDLRVILIVNSVVTFAAMNLNVVLTAAVTISFSGNPGELGLMHMLNAVGAMVGGFLLTRVDRITASTLGGALIAYSVSLGISAAAPDLLWFLLVAPLLGAGIGIYQAVLQSSAQMASPPDMIGRTMSLVTLGNFGIAPFGAVLIGLLIDATSAQWALWLGAGVTALTAASVWFVFRRREA